MALLQGFFWGLLPAISNVWFKKSFIMVLVRSDSDDQTILEMIAYWMFVLSWCWSQATFQLSNQVKVGHAVWHRGGKWRTSSLSVLTPSLLPPLVLLWNCQFISPDGQGTCDLVSKAYHLQHKWVFLVTDSTGVGAYSAEQIINHVYNLQIGGISITSKLHARKLQLKALINDYNSV